MEGRSKRWELFILFSIIALIVGGLGWGAGVLVEWRHRQDHQPFRDVLLQKDVLYVTGRKWPIVERTSANPLLRWLSQQGSAIELLPQPPSGAIPAGAEITILVHGFHSNETAIATYFAGVIDHLREAGYPGALVAFDWPSIAEHYGPEVTFTH